MNKLTFIEAISFLKEGKIILFFSDKSKYLASLKRQKIFIMSKNLTYYLPLKDFEELYRDASFYLYEESDETIDVKKDEEYYSYNALKH